MSGSAKKFFHRGVAHLGAFLGVVLSFFLIEVFAASFLKLEMGLWPLLFGFLWAMLLGGLIWALPAKAGRILYGISYFLFAIYAGIQTGYYILFKEMLWVSGFRYVSEGSDYLDILLTYPADWWLALLGLVILGVLMLRVFPKRKGKWRQSLLCVILAVIAGAGAFLIPRLVFLQDGDIQYADSDYGRMQSAEAAYDNMFNPLRLYQVCGVFQTLVKDVYTHHIYPMMPGYIQEQQTYKQIIDDYFSRKQTPVKNEMTGVLEGKNVILVLMESMDDWMIGEHTPTLSRLMEEGINFTQFYTPGYGGIRTFNTEFCINTGSFLSSRGGYAFDYVTNHFDQSLANQLRNIGYSALTFHYNDPSFYSRGVFSEAMGYEDYVCYMDYETDKDKLYDDQLLFDDPELAARFFREGQRLNFVITRSAHLSYKYNEVLSYWGLKKYPEYRGLTGNEETDCAYMKARLVDDLFERMLAELEARGELENTVIVGVTDHYTYGYKNEEALLELSGVDNKLLLERTPCFIWSPGLEKRNVDKVLNTSDLVPTLLNMLNIKSSFSYIGQDAFDSRYDGFVPFSNGSWIYGTLAWDASGKAYLSTDGSEPVVHGETERALQERVQEFINTNNLILENDYYMMSAE